MTASFEIQFDYPNVCRTLDIAKTFAAELSQGASDIAIIGAGLHKSLTTAFLREAKPPAAKPGYAPVGETGLYRAVNRNEPLVEPSQVLGHKLLTYYHLLSHFWLCNGLEKTCHERLVVDLNSNGMISDFEDAMRCTEYISKDEVGAEPGLCREFMPAV